MYAIANYPSEGIRGRGAIRDRGEKRKVREYEKRADVECEATKPDRLRRESRIIGE